MFLAELWIFFYLAMAVQIIQIWKWKHSCKKCYRIRKSHRTYCFHFTSNFPSNLAIFSIYYIFAQFMKLRGCRFLYFLSLCDVRNEAVFLIPEHSSLWGVGGEGGLCRKNPRKHIILAFKLLWQKIQLKNMTSRKIFWSSKI